MSSHLDRSFYVDGGFQGHKRFAVKSQPWTKQRSRSITNNEGHAEARGALACESSNLSGLQHGLHQITGQRCRASLHKRIHSTLPGQEIPHPTPQRTRGMPLQNCPKPSNMSSSNAPSTKPRGTSTIPQRTWQSPVPPALGQAAVLCGNSGSAVLRRNSSLCKAMYSRCDPGCPCVDTFSALLGALLILP